MIGKNLGQRWWKFFLFAVGGTAALLPAAVRAVDATWIYSVQVTAEVTAAPPSISLHWTQDNGLVVDTYTVSRKSPQDKKWRDLASLSGSTDSYVDEDVEVGTIYEYQIVKKGHDQYGFSPYTGYGYLASAINAPLVDRRGKVILVVDNSVADSLAGELARLGQDLTGDGWTVVRKDVGRDDNPAAVRDLIRAEYDADRDNASAVFLFGHVPVVRSGNLNVDGHQARPMPADVFYGEMDGKWTDANGDGIYDQNLLPSDVDLEVGRVDFADIDGRSVGAGFPGETELLRQYLEKDHAFRHALVRPALRALVGNAVGSASGQAYAASGYRNFAALVGPANVTTVEIATPTPVADRFIGKLSAADYLWAYGCGSGGDYAVNNLGTHENYNGLWSQDFGEQRAKGTFYLFFGSWFVDWSKPDNLLRAALTAPDYGLAAAWSGRPHLFFQHMGIGETIGYGIRLSQNNSGLYQNQVQRQLRGIHIALMGDPTLRLQAVAPPSAARVSGQGENVLVSWAPSPDPVIGYHVYRARDGGEFARITDSPIGETQIMDGGRGATYMVRAVMLQVGPSGSYYNASQGVFASDPGN